MTDHTQPHPHQYGPAFPSMFELRGIRLAELGGDGSGAGGNAAPGENSQDGQTTGSQAGGQQQGGEQKPADQQNGRQYTAEQTQQHITRLNGDVQTQRERADAEKERADAAEARSNAILKAAGFNPDGTTGNPEPEQVAQTLAERERELADARREKAVLLAAPASQADASKLLDSMTFRTALGKLDATDSAGIAGLVKATVEGNASAFAAAPPAAAASGGQQHQGDSKATGARLGKKAAFAAAYEPKR